MDAAHDAWTGSPCFEARDRDRWETGQLTRMVSVSERGGAWQVVRGNQTEEDGMGLRGNANLDKIGRRFQDRIT
jgi:hypothetical protein